ncbi:hypothetical protein F5879DRAFT_1047817 [Lentinula edodes]|nr:hypothetical protein F5879DRAFT_1047817 [Lentinula edodes]
MTACSDEIFDNITNDLVKKDKGDCPLNEFTSHKASEDIMSTGHIVVRVNTIVIRNTLHVSSYWREVKDEQISSIDLQLHVWKESPTEIDITQANKDTSTPHKLKRNLSFWWTFIFYIGRLSIVGGSAGVQPITLWTFLGYTVASIQLFSPQEPSTSCSQCKRQEVFVWLKRLGDNVVDDTGYLHWYSPNDEVTLSERAIT